VKGLGRVAADVAGAAGDEHRARPGVPAARSLRGGVPRGVPTARTARGGMRVSGQWRNT
jgi:hypothetical protein